MLPWKMVDKMNFVMNLVSSHRVLTEINLGAWTTNIYNSDHGVFIERIIKEEYDKMSQLLPHLILCSGHFLDHPKFIGSNGEKPHDFTFNASAKILCCKVHEVKLCIDSWENLTKLYSLFRF